MSEYDLGEALDISKDRVSKIEGDINTIKYIISYEFRKEANTTTYAQRGNAERLTTSKG